MEQVGGGVLRRLMYAWLDHFITFCNAATHPLHLDPRSNEEPAAMEPDAPRPSGDELREEVCAHLCMRDVCECTHVCTYMCVFCVVQERKKRRSARPSSVGRALA